MMDAFIQCKSRVKKFVVPVLFRCGYYSWILRKNEGNRCLILMYHRIDRDQPRGATETIGAAAGARGFSRYGISQRNFEKQMQFLREHMSPISLSFLAKSLQKRLSIPPGAVVVTFDDGYADNYFNAYPILKKYRIPATIFLATGYINTSKRFWWDRLRMVVRQNPRLPLILKKSCSLPPNLLAKWFSNEPQELAEALITYLWRNRNMCPEQLINLLGKGLDMNAPRWDYRDYAPQGAAYPQGAVYPQGDVSIQGKTSTQGGAYPQGKSYPQGKTYAYPQDDHALLTWDQVKEMSCQGIDFGSHTVSHPNMVHLSSQKVEEELKVSKEIIEMRLGRMVEGFAYPVGRGEHYDNRIKELVQKAGFRYACTAQKGCVYPQRWGGDMLSLKRIPPPDSLAYFVRDLSHYMSVPYPLYTRAGYFL